VIILFSIVCIVAAVAIATSIGWFLINSSVRGTALIGQERRSIAAAADNGTGACQELPGSVAGSAAGSGPRGLLEIPVLGLVAPVLQGTGDAVLNEAVGHDPGSAWPGQPGTIVLAAHDVTWFSSIGRLRPGDVLQYITPCRTYSYQVTAYHIVRAGSPVYTTAASRIVLDTCYPFDALYLTNSRYLVYADLTSARPTHPLTAAPAQPPPPQVPAPARLAAQGLGPDQNDAPLGTLTITGSPSAGWRQSSAPLDVQFAVLAAYFGVIHSAGQGEISWWADLAPSVPASAAEPIWGGVLSGYDTRLDIAIAVDGNQATGATLSAVVDVVNPEGAGNYDLTVHETVRAGKLLVTGFTMRPAR
jgi:sortase A